jgi:hypothetical protein
MLLLCVPLFYSYKRYAKRAGRNMAEEYGGIWEEGIEKDTKKYIGVSWPNWLGFCRKKLVYIQKALEVWRTERVTKWNAVS